MRLGRRQIGLGLGLAGLGLIAAASWGVGEVRALAALDQARRDVAGGRMGSARVALLRLAGRRPGWDEVHYQLGLCHRAEGRPDDAIAAWRRVGPRSPFAGRAALFAARLALDLGRMEEAEELLLAAIGTDGPDRKDARWDLVRLLRLEGRFDEARHRYEAGIAGQTDEPAMLRMLHRLDVEPFPVEGVRRFLDRAESKAPDDDRVALGQAHLATRLGRFEEADRRLQICEARRPDDPAVWRARLEWSLAADRPESARAALSHIPAGPDATTNPDALRAWFAASRHDREAERTALLAQLESDPGALEALDRIAAIALESNRPDEAATARARKAALEDDRAAYARLLAEKDTKAHAIELARLASRIGLRFDAARWAALGGATLPPPPTPPPGRTLADLLPDLAAPAMRSSVPDGLLIPRFVDEAESRGLRFIHENGGGERGRLIPPVTASGGVALIDFDGDGWLDVFAVQSGTFPPDAATPHGGDRLFRNRRDGTFEDVTARSGIAGFPRGYGHGVAVGDIDNDGHPDLFITRWKSYSLYRNKGDGTFEDVTARAGLGGDRDWPTSAAFADLDGDGDLDLYVCHYLLWDASKPRPCIDPANPAIYHCNPRDFPALADHVFRNDGSRFVDATAEAGIIDRDGRGLGVVAADLDDDGKVDLFVANDTTANYLFLNRGGFRFEESALSSGVAANAAGSFQAGMGVACGDLDGDGRVDLAVTNFYNESTTFFRNFGGGSFADHTAGVGLAVPSRYLLGFGAAFLDANNDGRLDLLTVNGHVHDGRPQFPWTMPAQLLIGTARGRLLDVTDRAGPPFAVLRLGRGLAVGDIDNDGRVDAVVLSQGAPLALFRNRTEAPGHSLTVGLEGSKSNRDGVGAKVIVRAGGRDRVAHRFGGGSYQSSGDPRLHFGLGSSDRVESVEVRWPSGRTDRFVDLGADAGYLLREGASNPVALPGFEPPVSRTSR
jgi:thioredoxin-like negative regulator of GroEL